jgi:hypothetical protein
MEPVPANARQATGTSSPFLVAPEDVPDEVVRALRRTILRRRPGDGDGDVTEEARLLGAVAIAALARDPGAWERMAAVLPVAGEASQ